MKSKLFLTSLLVVFALVASGVSRADLLSGCATCQGSTYLLTYNPANTTLGSGGVSIYDVFLTIDTSGYNGGGSFLDAVSIKISNSVDATQSSLISAPGGTGAWALQDGGLNANGCSGAGAGFLCAQDGQTAPVPDGTYVWEFHYATADALFLGNLASSIKARYVNADGTKVGDLVSEDITLQQTPEPASLLLLGSGLAACAGLIRRRRTS